MNKRGPSAMSNGGARAALFGGATAARLPAVGAGGSSSSSAAMQDALESDNDRLIAELEQKTSALRHATQSIHDEVQADNAMLAGMGADFERTGGLMAGTLSRLDGLVRAAGGSPHMCRLVLFIVALFLGLYFLLRRL